jgi:hypothetical protein
MRRSKILPATMAAEFALAAPGTAFASPGEHENDHDRAAVLGVTTSVAQAIAAAEQQSGARSTPSIRSRRR